MEEHCIKWLPDLKQHLQVTVKYKLAVRKCSFPLPTVVPLGLSMSLFEGFYWHLDTFKYEKGQLDVARSRWAITGI